MAKDIFHEQAKQALIKDGWNITHDPFFIKVADVEFYIDLAAEHVIGAERNGDKIAVEIKSFRGSSTISEFHTALGQFMNYRLALAEDESDRELYLAIPVDIYNSFFKLRFGQLAIQQYQLKLILFDATQEVIIKWIN